MSLSTCRWGDERAFQSFDRKIRDVQDSTMVAPIRRISLFQLFSHVVNGSKEMTIIENNIHQTKNQSRQDPLNFGIRLNNHLTFLMGYQQRGDYPPTVQAEEVRKELSAKLDKELQDLDGLWNEKLNKINEMMKNQGPELLNRRKGKDVN